MSPTAAKSTRAHFHELLVEGHPERCQGLLTGLLIGSGGKGRLYFAEDVGVRTPLGERILEFVHLQAGVSHVLADAAARRVLKSHAKVLEGHGIRVLQEKKIVSARFEYHYHAYAREYGQQIQDVLKSLPKTLKREGGKPEVHVDKGAKGVEVYSPVHHYEIEAEGAFVSPRLDLLIQARHELDVHPLIDVEPIELTLA